MPRQRQVEVNLSIASPEVRFKLSDPKSELIFMLGDIKNYYQMTERVATSGQPTEQQFKDIAADGNKVVINLAMPDGENALPEEGKIVSGLGMMYIHLPVPWESPEQTHLSQFIRLMKAMEPQKVWVHCVVNARVSAFNYHYMKTCLGLPEDSCESPLLKKWKPQMEDQWVKFLDLDVTGN